MPCSRKTVNVSSRSTNLTFPPDPFIYNGPLGVYRFSSYSGSPLSFVWAATFFFTCLGDLFDTLSIHNHNAFDPYPNGSYKCKRYFTTSTAGERIACELNLNKVDAPGWRMTFYDIVQELQAIWFAALWFHSTMLGLPTMNLEVHRYVGDTGVTFFAETGSIIFMMIYPSNNVSVT